MPRKSPRDTSDQLNKSESSEDSLVSSRTRSKKHLDDNADDNDNSTDFSLNNSTQSSIFSSSPSKSELDTSLHTYESLSDGPSPVPSARRRGVYPIRSDNDNLSVEKTASLESRSSKTTRKTQVECSSHSGMFLIMIVLIVICCLIIIPYVYSSSPQQVTKTGLTQFEQFLHDVDNLQDKFPDQRQQLWKTFKASAKHILNSTDSPYPSVILMASDTLSAGLASCLANKLASSFESSRGLVPGHATVDVEFLRSMDVKTQKLRLDEKLISALQSQEGKSFVIKNLQFLSAEAALLLHSYCDGDNAPYKDVMLILSLQVDPKESALDPDMPSGVESYLSWLWEQSLDSDKVAALMSRVANNIVVVSQEHSDQWKRRC